jgi:EthD domain
VVRLTCLLRRKPGLTPEEFHEHWREVHGPLIVALQCGSHVLRYEQHPRPMSDYATGKDDGGFDGVTVQWFETMDDYNAHTTETDFPEMWKDVESFLDTDRLHFILTEDPRLVIGDPDPFPLA